jgi:hypothetical protein
MSPTAPGDVDGWVVLLDGDRNEVVERQRCLLRWKLTSGGAEFAVTTRHEFDILGRSITYLGVGVEDRLLFLSIVTGYPVEGSAIMSIGS